MKTLGIIPARYASTRFPGKPLVKILGKTMIQRVFLQSSKSLLIDEVLVATDDSRIFDHVTGFGGKAILTASNHHTGTERCAEVARQYADTYDLVINIQGDEPFIQPQQIDLLVQFMADHSEITIGTIAMPIKEALSLFNPNHIKVVFDKRGRALYFSRAPIPYLRETKQESWLDNHIFYKHIGMYAYTTASLLQIAELPQGILEAAESLEQLRWMENGYNIGVLISDYESPSIDTPEDLENVLQSGRYFE